MTTEQIFQLQELHLQAADQLGYIRMFKEAELVSEPSYFKAEIEAHEKAFAAINRKINRATMPDSLFELLLEENKN